MLGIFFFGMTGLWVVGLFLAARFITRKLADKNVRNVLTGAIVLALVPLPIVDELLGRMEFDKLCRERAAAIKVDRARAVGRTVYLARSETEQVDGTWLRAYVKPWQFDDAATKERVLEYNTIEARGGWLVRALGGGNPLTYRGRCLPGGSRDTEVKLMNELGIKTVKRPQ